MKQLIQMINPLSAYSNGIKIQPQARRPGFWHVFKRHFGFIYLDNCEFRLKKDPAKDVGEYGGGGANHDEVFHSQSMLTYKN